MKFLKKLEYSNLILGHLKTFEKSNDFRNICKLRRKSNSNPNGRKLAQTIFILYIKNMDIDIILISP